MDKEEIKNLLYALHHSTYRNEQQIKNSKDCGCFHCKTIFKAEFLRRKKHLFDVNRNFE